MNLLEKIEAALDCATPPMSDLLRECEAYVRAGMDQPPVIYIAEDDVGGFMASRTPDGDYPWEPLYRHPMPPADECDELLLIAHMDGYYKGKQDGQKVPDGTQLVPDSLVEFITQVQGQTPEKPDYWSSCGQCEHNANRADDLLDELKAARIDQYYTRRRKIMTKTHHAMSMPEIIAMQDENARLRSALAADDDRFEWLQENVDSAITRSNIDIGMQAVNSKNNNHQPTEDNHERD